MPMPASRKTHKKWPAYVHEANGRIVYRPRVNGKFITPVRLGKVGITDAEVWAAYNEAIKGMEPEGTLGWLSDCFQKSEQFKERSPRTQSDYKFHSRVLKATLNKGKITLAKVNLKDISTPFIRQLLDKRAAMYQENGKSNVPANREIAYLSCVFSWGLQYKHLQITVNPCKGIKKKPENVRKEHISGADRQIGHYKAVYDLANEREQIIMELMYCCACRGQEVLNMQKSDRKENGLLVRRLKGSKDNIVEYSNRLNKAINRAMAMHKDLRNIYLIPGRNGKAVSRSTLNSALQRLNKKCKKEGVEPIRLHDLKGTGYTDGDDEKLTGHKSESMRNKYRVLPENVKPAG